MTNDGPQVPPYIAPGRKPVDDEDDRNNLRDALKDARATCQFLAVSGGAVVIANLIKLAATPSLLAGTILIIAVIQVLLSIVGSFRSTARDVDEPEVVNALRAMLAMRHTIRNISAALFALSLIGVVFLFFGQALPPPK